MHALSFESVILHLLQLGANSKSQGLCLPHTSPFPGIFPVVITTIHYFQIQIVLGLYFASFPVT